MLEGQEMFNALVQGFPQPTATRVAIGAVHPPASEDVLLSREVAGKLKFGTEVPGLKGKEEAEIPKQIGFIQQDIERLAKVLNILAVKIDSVCNLKVPTPPVNGLAEENIASPLVKELLKIDLAIANLIRGTEGLIDRVQL